MQWILKKDILLGLKDKVENLDQMSKEYEKKIKQWKVT